jgi:hypothetical protein
MQRLAPGDWRLIQSPISIISMKLYLFGPLRLEIDGEVRLLTGSPAALLGLLGLQEATGYAAHPPSRHAVAGCG